MMHNWWVEILVAYGGALIFVLYVIFYVNLWLSMYRTYRDSSCSKDRSISIGIMCCMAGYVIGSVSASSNISVEWLWSFWGGLCIVYQGITSTTKRVNVLSRAQL